MVTWFCMRCQIAHEVVDGKVMCPKGNIPAKLPTKEDWQVIMKWLRDECPI